MELNEHPCVISAGIGGWYPYGIKRLEKSLLFEGWPGDVITWTEYPDGCPAHHDNPYAFKIFAFRDAFKRGSKVVVWVDSSLWAVGNIMPIFDYVNEHGLWFFKSGYSISQTATDKLLHYHGRTRESLIETPEFATGCVGINIDNPRGKEFFTEWEHSMELGLFKGNRVHDPADSEDMNFLFSRQDQSAASMILCDMGIKEFDTPPWCAYKGGGYDAENIKFFIGGI